MVSWKSVEFDPDSCFRHTSLHVYLHGLAQWHTNQGLELEAVQLHQWESLIRATILASVCLNISVCCFTLKHRSQLCGTKGCALWCSVVQASFIQYLLSTLCVFQWFRVYKQRYDVQNSDLMRCLALTWISQRYCSWLIV